MIIFIKLMRKYTTIKKPDINDMFMSSKFIPLKAALFSYSIRIFY